MKRRDLILSALTAPLLALLSRKQETQETPDHTNQEEQPKEEWAIAQDPPAICNCEYCKGCFTPGYCTQNDYCHPHDHPHPQGELDPHNIPSGLYRIHWKSGGTSLAAIGITHDGTRWFWLGVWEVHGFPVWKLGGGYYAPTNWTTAYNYHPLVASTDWSKIAHLDQIKILPTTGPYKSVEFTFGRPTCKEWCKIKDCQTCLDEL